MRKPRFKAGERITIAVKNGLGRFPSFYGKKYAEVVVHEVIHEPEKEYQWAYRLYSEDYTYVTLFDTYFDGPKLNSEAKGMLDNEF